MKKIALVGPVNLNQLPGTDVTPIPRAGYPYPLLAELAVAYREIGYAVQLVTTSQDHLPSVNYPTVDPALHVHVVPARSSARKRGMTLFGSEINGLAKAIQDSDPDVVHAHWTYEFARAAQLSGKPHLITAHDWPPTVLRYMPNAYRLLRAVLAARVCLTGSEMTAPSTYLARRYRRLGAHCSVIHNGATLAAVPRQAPSHPVVLMCNSSFDRRKNATAALRAWPLVLQAVPNARLRLLGPQYGPDGPCFQWARKRELTEGVSFGGPVSRDQLARELSRANSFLHTSREETFGMVLLEAMTCGVPPIVMPRAGASGEVATSECSYHLNSFGRGHIAEQVVRSLTEIDRHEAKAIAAQQRAANFTPVASAMQYAERMQNILGSK